MAGTEDAFYISELVSMHQGEWLALEVVDRDSDGRPKKARLLATGNDRLELREKVKDRNDVYIKFAGPLAPAEYGFIY